MAAETLNAANLPGSLHRASTAVRPGNLRCLPQAIRTLSHDSSRIASLSSAPSTGHQLKIKAQNQGGGGRGGRSARVSGRGGKAGHRRKEEGALPKGAFQIKDPESGDMVLVWGPDDPSEAHFVKPKPEDLSWEPAVVIGSGMVSDEQLWKAMEGDRFLPSGGYAAKGMRYSGEEPGDQSFFLNEDDEEEQDEGEDEEILDEEEEEEDDEADPEEERGGGDDVMSGAREPAADDGVSAARRKPRLKVFGRDFGNRGTTKPPTTTAANANADVRDLDGETRWAGDGLKDKADRANVEEVATGRSGEELEEGARDDSGEERGHERGRKFAQESGAWQRLGGGFEGIVEVEEGGRGRSSERPVDGGLLEQLRMRALGSKGVRGADRGGGGEGEGERAAVRVAEQGSERANYDVALVDEFLSAKSFQQLGASAEVIQALKSLGIRRPSHIQALAFKPLVNGRDGIVADQTGTGKTLAYLAPLMQRLHAEEVGGGGRAGPNQPFLLILVPTTELAAQVLRVTRLLADGGLRLRSLAITGGRRWRTQVEGLNSGAEIVVATPGRLLQHLEANTIQLTRLKAVVVDEADILFDDEGFAATINSVRQAVTGGSTQWVHVTATLPEDVHDSLVEEYPGAVSLMGPSLHRTAAGLQEVLVDCSGEGERTEEAAFARKRQALLQLMDRKGANKTIVFCNKIDTCRKVENALQRHDRSRSAYTVLPYHAALAPEKAQAALQDFLHGTPTGRMVLVCTDRASRGVDSADVEQVVLFDFPRDPSEYVRRVGRTARGAGGTGCVFVFAVGRQVALARRIMARNDKGLPVHNVPGSQY